MPKLSIVVPCYNVEKYVGQCIESLLAQTLTDIEIILVDDGSPDRSGEICDDYAARDSRIRVIHKANGGVSAARNDGLAQAVGEYVIFVDSDDCVPADAYALMCAKAEETGADIVIGDVCKIYDDGRQEYCAFYTGDFVSGQRAYIEKLICADFYKNYCPNPPAGGPAFGYGGPWNKLVRRSMLLENGIRFDVRLKGLFDDILYSAYILAACKTVAYISKPVYCYRMVSNSITQTYKKNMPEIAAAIIGSFREFLEKYNHDAVFDDAYNAFVVRMLAYSLPRYYCSKKNDAPLRERVSALKAVMKQEPYATAAVKADQSVLTRGQRMLAKLIRHRAALLTILYFQFK